MHWVLLIGYMVVLLAGAAMLARAWRRGATFRAWQVLAVAATVLVIGVTGTVAALQPRLQWAEQDRAMERQEIWTDAFETGMRQGARVCADLPADQCLEEIESAFREQP